MTAPNLHAVSGKPKHRSRPAAAEVSRELERALLSGLMLDPSRIPSVLSILGPEDLADSKLRPILQTMVALHQDGHPVTLPVLVDELDRSGELDCVGGPVTLAEISDFEATAATVEHHARRIRRLSLEREERGLHSRAADGERDQELIARLAEVEAELTALETGRGGLSAAAFTGDSLLSLANRTAPPPVSPGAPPPGHLTELIAPKGFGKTTMSLVIAAARACGAPPWPGAPEPEEPGRILIITPDEPPEVAARRLRGLSVFAERWTFQQAAPNLEMVGPDRELPSGILERLRFNDDGLASLESALALAKREGRPYVGVHLDAWIDFLPAGVSENDNAVVGLIGGRLEALAVRFECYVLLLHHEGKPQLQGNGEGRDPRFAGRGASALNAKARCVFSLEMVSGSPHLRRLRTVTNLGPGPKSMTFAVCSPDAKAEELLYWRPVNELDAHDLEKLLEMGEELSTTALAWRIADQAPKKDKSPPGDAVRLARRLREHWSDDPRVVVGEGDHGAKTIRRIQ